MTDSHWTDAHITYDLTTKLFTGWDETGADTVKVSKYRASVVLALIDYDTRLQEREREKISWL